MGRRLCSLLVLAAVACSEPPGASGPTIFFTSTEGNADSLRAVRLYPATGERQAVAVPAELGDQLRLVAVHFSSPTTGVALIADLDGGTENVVVYDAATNAWKSVAATTNPDIASCMPFTERFQAQLPHAPTPLARSWTDGSFVVALALTNADHTQSLWSVTSVAGSAPVERVTPLDISGEPLLDPSARMFVTLVGADSPARLNAFASAALDAPPRSAFLTIEVPTGAVQAHELADGATGAFGGPGFGVDDYFLTEARKPEGAPHDLVQRYCRVDHCSTVGRLAIPHVEGFPFSILAWKWGPEPWVRVGDLRGVEPVAHTVQLPTASTEISLAAVLPDPFDASWIRLIVLDMDQPTQPTPAAEFRYQPTTGITQPVKDRRLADGIPCLVNGCGNASEWRETYTNADRAFFVFPAP